MLVKNKLTNTITGDVPSAILIFNNKLMICSTGTKYTERVNEKQVCDFSVTSCFAWLN